MNTKLIFLLCIALITSIWTGAQENYSFTPSTSISESIEIQENIDHYYKTHSEMINSSSLDNKQRYYLRKQLLNRKDFSEKLVENGDVILDGPLVTLIDNLLNEIKSGNPSIPSNVRAYVIKDLSANAFTVGNDIIYLNLGLLYRLNTTEELIFVMCHELAHNSMEHGYKSLMYHTNQVMNDSVSSALRKSLRKRYGNVSAANELMLPILFDTKEQSRIREYEADSLGLAYYMNLGLEVNHVHHLFELFEQFEHERASSWEINNEVPHSCLPDSTAYTGMYKGSSFGSFKRTKKEYEDKLRTHPFEDERRAKIDSLYPSEIASDSLSANELPEWKKAAENEFLFQCLEQHDLTQLLFSAMQTEKELVDTAFVRDLASMSLMLLAFEKDNRNAGNWLGWLNTDRDQHYNDFKVYLRDLSPEETRQLAECNESKLVPSRITDYYWAFKYAILKDHDKFKIMYDKIKDYDFGSELYDMLLNHYNLNRLMFK